MNINKTLAISEMLEKHLAGQVVEIKKRSFKIIDMNCPVLEIKMQFETDKLLQAAERMYRMGQDQVILMTKIILLILFMRFY